MGKDIPFENVSGSVRTVNNFVRPAQPRGALGRWKPRAAREVGPLGQPGGTGPGGVDTVTGQWIPGAADHAQLHDLERVHTVTTKPYYVAPDWSQDVEESRKSHRGADGAHARAERAAE